MDKISMLSDELLVKILEFLPTKVAVSTSVLSKRWEFLWMWLPKLEYSDSQSSRSESKKLRCFLDRNLPLHRAPVIESLCLNLNNSHFKPEVIKLMVVIAVSRYVRELEISYFSDPDKPNILPSNLYTCKSLVILKLEGGILLDVPRMVFLPSLKTLQLQIVKYFDEESLQRLLSSCPVLEDLLVDIWEDDNMMRKFTVIVPSLLRLSLYIPYECDDVDGYVIDTPSLKSLKLKDYSDTNHYCSFENMPNLIEAYVDVQRPDIKSLIGSITSVKRLTICSKAMYDEGFVFSQLEHLKLCRCGNYSSDLLVRLLKDSPNLRMLDLLDMDSHYRSEIVQWNQPSTVPECVLSSLQIFIWSLYTGYPEESEVAVYILKNAGHLKTAKISSYEDNVPKLEMLKELALSSRASTTCQLIFDYLVIQYLLNAQYIVSELVLQFLCMLGFVMVCLYLLKLAFNKKKVFLYVCVSG